MRDLIVSAKGWIKEILFSIASKIDLWKYFTRKTNIPRILMYHRLTDSDIIPGITPIKFEDHLKHLCSYYNVVPVDEIISDVNSNQLNSNKVALTFDDGYVDFYEKAWPLLKKYNVPASVYITTEFIEKKRWMWPDKVRVMLDQTIHERVYIPNVGELQLAKKYFDRNWHTISDHCLTLTELNRNCFFDELARLLGVSVNDYPTSDFSALTWEQLSLMHQEGLDIGSHTVTHPILTNIPNEQLTNELVESKREIENMLNLEVKGICYPNGMPSDVSTAVTETADNSGYCYGLIAYTDSDSYTDLFKTDRLPASENIADFAFSLLSNKS